MTTVTIEPAQALKRLPLFKDFSSAELDALVSRVVRRVFPASYLIFEQGAIGNSCHLIRRGLVKIFVTSDGGQDAVLAMLRPGELFGELAVIDGLPRSASAITAEPTETLEISCEEFWRMLEQHPAAARKVCAVLAARLRRTDNIVADGAFLDTRARVSKRLLDLAEQFGRRRRDGSDAVDLDLVLYQQDLAEMVGSTRESVSRVLSALESDGLVRQQRGRVTLLRIDDLAEICGYGPVLLGGVDEFR